MNIKPSNVAALEDLGRVRLSASFFFRDFLYSEISSVHGIPNIPDDPDLAIASGSRLCEELLEPLQATFGRIAIRSAYRSPAVNAFGARATSITAPASYELPPDAVDEAIVNAIAHRDYYSNASIEVRLFADRLEVWNPGTMPGTLTLDDLRAAHPSVPNNPLIAESLYLTRYIEKTGSGTERMIELCREAALPEPSFQVRAGSFVITLWRDWLTAEVLAGLQFNDRQQQATLMIKTTGR